MHARDLMTPAPAVITPYDTVLRAAQVMRTMDVGMLPVVSDMNSLKLVGVITDRDIVVRHDALEHGPTARVHEHMTREPLVTVSPMTSLSEVAERMTRWKVRRLPVVDDQHRVVGIIAQADLATHVGPTDPRLVESVVEGISQRGQLVH